MFEIDAMRSIGVCPWGVILPNLSVISSINRLKSSSRLPTCQYTVGVPTPSSAASLRMLKASTPLSSIIFMAAASTLSTVMEGPVLVAAAEPVLLFCTTTSYLSSWSQPGGGTMLFEVPRIRYARRCALVVLDELHQIAVKILHVGHRHRPALEPTRGRNRFAPRGNRLVVQRHAIVGVHVELPHGSSHVDRTILVEVLCELHATAPGRGLQHCFLDIRDLRSALHRYPNDALPEVDSPVEITDVDAVLRKNRHHRTTSCRTVGSRANHDSLDEISGS